MDGEPVKNLKEINSGINNNSGIIAAAYLATIKQVRNLYLIGYDFFLPVPGGSNDIYGSNTAHPKLIARVFNLLPESNPQTRFIRVGPIADEDRDFYKTLEGFEFMETFDYLPTT
ncbi:MAG: hypothetical protein GY869_30940 [Planctomycetes bacterium]|nr:hypothetical protein [Planctomycetota bacterium]